MQYDRIGAGVVSEGFIKPIGIVEYLSEDKPERGAVANGYVRVVEGSGDAGHLGCASGCTGGGHEEMGLNRVWFADQDLANAIGDFVESTVLLKGMGQVYPTRY